MTPFQKTESENLWFFQVNHPPWRKAQVYLNWIRAALSSVAALFRVFNSEIVRAVGPGLPPEPLDTKRHHGGPTRWPL